MAAAMTTGFEAFIPSKEEDDLWASGGWRTSFRSAAYAWPRGRFCLRRLARLGVCGLALALAVIVVWLLQPETVTDPGFQMSFSATAALVALAEIWPQRVR